MTDRLSPEQIAAAADALAPRRRRLPPMRDIEVLDIYNVKLGAMIADLWTLREAIEAGRPGGRHLAVSQIPALAEKLGDARDIIVQIADDLDLRLPPID